MTLVSLNGKETVEFVDNLVKGMTKQHYEQIAAGLLVLKGTIPDKHHEEAVRGWADMCEKKNPNFNREKFYKAAGAYVPPPAEENNHE